MALRAHIPEGAERCPALGKVHGDTNLREGRVVLSLALLLMLENLVTSQVSFQHGAHLGLTVRSQSHLCAWHPHAQGLTCPARCLDGTSQRQTDRQTRGTDQDLRSYGLSLVSPGM